MPTLGEELRHKREQRGTTLAEIAEATRIGTRFLKAIETDNFSILPGGIFTRSFIRAYAKHVGMNEDEAIGLYLQQVAGPTVEQQQPGDKPSIQAAPAQTITKPTPAAPRIARPAAAASSRRYEPVTFRQSPSRTSWPTIVIGAGIVIFIVIIVIALVKQLNQGGGETESQATSTEQKNAPSKQAPQTGQQPAPQPGSRAAGQPASPPLVETSPPSAPAVEPLLVKIEAATGDSWVKYQIDDAKPTTLVLKRGQSQDLPPAQSQVTLNYGNRTTLKLKINNRDANFPADTPKFASQVVISRDNFKTFFQ